MNGNKPVPPEKRSVWIACRATEGCDGNIAVIDQETDHELPMGKETAHGGKSVRYVCRKCGRAFHVNR